MLRITINGKQAALPPDVEIGITLNNYILVERKEDATYPLTLSLKANRHIFGFPERAACNGFRQELPAEVSYGPYTLLAGRAVITDITEEEVELFIATKTSSFWGVNSSFYIDELDLGGERFTEPAYLQEQLDRSLREYLPFVCVELYDPDYETGTTIPHYYNRWDFVGQRLMREWGVRFNTYSPFMRLVEVVERVIAACGYSVRTNDLRKIAGFEDILLIRRSRLGKDSTALSYAGYVPHLTVKDFFDEIERKFSVRLFVNEAAREVSLRSAAAIRTPGYRAVEVLDGIRKTFAGKEEEGSVKNYKFFDKEIQDPNWQRYKDYLTLIVGEDKDTENTECISTVVASRLRHDVVDPVGHEIGGEYETNVHVSYEQLISVAAVAGEPDFRLAVYRGIRNRATDGPQADLYGNVPLATPDPVADCENKLSLLWTGEEGLYKRFHEARVKGLNFVQSHELLLVPDINMLAAAPLLLSGNIVARGQRYIVEQEEIQLGRSGILEHKLTVHPV